MIDVGKELEKYRSIFDHACEKEKDHPNFNKAETVKYTYLIHNYNPGASENRIKDIHKLGDILGHFYKNKYIWTNHFDAAALGSLDKYLEKGKYKTI